MELITILSTIILVATISTFILSIGAYILYKIRSRKELSPLLNAAVPTKAELVTVSEQEYLKDVRQQVGRTNYSRSHLDELEREESRTDRKINNVTEKQKHEKVNPSKFVKYNSAGYSSSDKDRSTGDIQWK